MKILKLETVKAVGGCQHEALVALLKEMGYAIETAKQGVLVKPGMRVIGKSGTAYTVAPKGAHIADTGPSTLSLYHDSGSILWCDIDFYTYYGKPVIGYEK